MIPNKIIIHHSLTKDGQRVSWGAIRKYHVGTLGFDDIGYQFGIELIGDHYETLIGRRPDKIGAHTIGQNDHSLGICIVGNYDEEEIPGGVKDTLYDLIAWLMQIYKFKNSDIYGHCEFANKSCPGKNLFNWVKEIRKGY